MMSQSTLLPSKLKINVDIKTEYLVHGYIRYLKIIDQIIPSSIIQICIAFYHSTLKIVYYTGNYGVLPLILISEPDHGDHYECSITQLSETNNDIVLDGTYVSVDHGACYTQNFNFPKNMFSLFGGKINKKDLYDVLFIGGGSRYTAYIINTSQNYTTYYWELPATSNSVTRTFLQYSQKYGLVTLGNLNESSSFNILSFNDDDINKLKWKEGEMQRWRKYPSASMILNDQIICVGGWDNNVYVKYIDIYDFTKNEWIKLNDLNLPRCKTGACFDKFTNTKVFIGGGKPQQRSVECYDMEKNVCLKLNDTSLRHDNYPVLWTEDMNILHIASAAGGGFEKMDLRQKQWVIYADNSSNDGSIENIFGSKIKQFGCRLLV